MSAVASDRWSCPHPGCHKTVVIHGFAEDVLAAIIACQRRHYDEHRTAAERFGPNGRRRLAS